MWRHEHRTDRRRRFRPDAYIGETHVTAPERAALADLQALGLRDVVRERWPTERVFTYWDYRPACFTRTSGCGSILYWRARRSPTVLVRHGGPAGPQGQRPQRSRPGDRRPGRGARWGHWAGCTAAVCSCGPARCGKAAAVAVNGPSGPGLRSVRARSHCRGRRDRARAEPLRLSRHLGIVGRVRHVALPLRRVVFVPIE